MSIWTFLSRSHDDIIYMDIHGMFSCTIGPCLAMYPHKRKGDISVRVIYWVRKRPFTEYPGTYGDNELTVGEKK